MRRYRDCSYTPAPTCQAFPIFSIPYHSGAFAQWYIDEPTLIHHCHPKSIIDMRVHSWCCTFYGFGHMYPSLWFHTEYFFALKILCVLPIHSSLCYNPWQSLMFLLSPNFHLFQNAIELESYSMEPVQTGFFHLVICNKGPPYFFMA